MILSQFLTSEYILQMRMARDIKNVVHQLTDADLKNILVSVLSVATHLDSSLVNFAFSLAMLYFSIIFNTHFGVPN